MIENVFSEKLQCHWLGWRVIGGSALRLDLPPHNSTDMTGTVKMAKALMPGVNAIQVFVDGEIDTFYKKRDGSWLAYRWRGVAATKPHTGT